MPRRKLPYTEGDWFGVPLLDGSWALGVAARTDGKGFVLGYFFGPRRPQVPNVNCAGGLTSREAVFVCRFGGLGLLRGEWPVLGRLEPWVREDWPLPLFVRVSFTDPNEILVIKYDEKTLTEIGNVRGGQDAVRAFPADGLCGSGSVQMQLSELLGVDRHTIEHVWTHWLDEMRQPTRGR